MLCCFLLAGLGADLAPEAGTALVAAVAAVTVTPAVVGGPGAAADLAATTGNLQSQGPGPGLAASPGRAPGE